MMNRTRICTDFDEEVDIFTGEYGMRRITFLIPVVVLATIPQLGSGADYFLTIGGGPTPTNNQVSLEKNVLMLESLLQEKYPGGVAHEIYFADGASRGRDLQFYDEAKVIPEANRLLAQVMRQQQYLTLGYRSHEIKNVNASSSRESISKWFEDQGSQLKQGDRLFVYVTAHGGRSSDKKAPENTKLYLWNNQSYQQSEMTELFNKVPESVPVVLVMVQCYSGGFAETVLAKTDSGKQLDQHNRCGFFATVQTRPAAGCTPDIDEENYEEYSSYFWSALRGKRRNGEPIEPPDYDRDGSVSFEEAHAYAVLNSPTIDIPVKTSDAALRALSRLGDDKNPGLLSAHSPIDELESHATPAELAILKGLSEQLELSGRDRADEAEKLSKQLDGRRKEIDKEIRKQNGIKNSILNELSSRLKMRWPELNNRWDPQVGALLTTDSEQVVRMIKQHPRYEELNRIEQEIDRADAQSLDLEKRWCKCQRLIRALENLALRANLPKVADSDQQRSIDRLLAAERGTLEASRETPPQVSQSPAP